jgi:hypothetical protein
LCAILAREAEPSGGPNPARGLDRGAGRFLLDLIDGSERRGGAGAAAVAAALELGGRLRQQADRVFAVCALQDFEWRDGALYPLAGRRRARRRIMPELEATAPTAGLQQRGEGSPPCARSKISSGGMVLFIPWRGGAFGRARAQLFLGQQADGERD